MPLEICLDFKNKYIHKNTIDSFNKISMVFLFVSHLALFIKLFQKTFLPNFVPVENFKPLQTLVLWAFLFVFNYSHSIVAGGLLVISYTTLLICPTSFTILLDISPSIDHGRCANSAVMKSVVVTALRARV